MVLSLLYTSWKKSRFAKRVMADMVSNVNAYLDKNDSFRALEVDLYRDDHPHSIIWKEVNLLVKTLSTWITNFQMKAPRTLWAMSLHLKIPIFLLFLRFSSNLKGNFDSFFSPVHKLGHFWKMVYDNNLPLFWVVLCCFFKQVTVFFAETTQ